MSEAKAQIRGAEIAYEVAGSGPDLVWGHGLTQTRANESALGLVDWNRVPARVLRYDARGHGRSETTPDLGGYSWLELAHDQLALADAVGIDSYVAAGASMGCGTALHAAVLAPDRIDRLVLVIPPTGWEARSAQADQWELTAKVIEVKGVERIIAARAELAPPDPFVGDDERRQLQDDATRAWDPSRLATVMRGATTANLPDREQIRAIGMPALILAWTGDPVHPAATASELVDLLPDAELHLASTQEQVDSWTDRIATFISAS